jgi:hypothetical protein
MPNGTQIGLAVVPTLDELARDRERAHRLSPEVLAALTAKTASVQGLLATEARAASMIKSRKRTDREQAVEGPDRTLDADEAAKRIGAKRCWLFLDIIIAKNRRGQPWVGLPIRFIASQTRFEDRT